MKQKVFFHIRKKFYRSLNLGKQWKKVYSFHHPASLGTEGYFQDANEAMNKNSDDENGEMFSILNKLEDFRTCRGHFHFKICYPELAENFSFPCNEWIQTSNPVLDSITRDFKPIHLTFKSAHSDFKGLAKSERGEEETLIEDFPHQYNSRAFSVGTLKGREGKIPGPGHILVEKVVLYVNACKYKIFTCKIRIIIP